MPKDILDVEVLNYNELQALPQNYSIKNQQYCRVIYLLNNELWENDMKYKIVPI